jgi:hypothetical protein
MQRIRIIDMNSWRIDTLTAKPIHPWLHPIRCVAIPGPATPLIEEVLAELLAQFRSHNHHVQDVADESTDLILTTARFGEPVQWREALLFSARRRLHLERTPSILTLVHMRPSEFEQMNLYFEGILQKDPLDPKDYEFPGLAPAAYYVLHEQGRRGGSIMALERLIQAQAKSIRVLLVVGEDRPEVAYHFDLVGAHPKSVATTTEAFYEDIVLRTVTTLSTRDVAKHQRVDEPIPYSLWETLGAPPAMRNASQELGQRNFFTEMVRITDLVHVPAVGDAVSSQYSEGCYATWDSTVNGLIATVTGSARPVKKGDLTDDDLAVIVGLREDGMGALVRHVDGKRNDPPSSEAVEMMDMDSALPVVTLGSEWGEEAGRQVPATRSKLHGHRGVDVYDPAVVEFVALEPAYYHYLVSCATEAQAQGIKGAFARSETLHNPEDPRQIVFTVLPGHGVMIAEKWVPGKAPFQVLWEAMDAGTLQVANHVPQGPMWYVPNEDGMMVVKFEV